MRSQILKRQSKGMWSPARRYSTFWHIFHLVWKIPDSFLRHNSRFTSMKSVQKKTQCKSYRPVQIPQKTADGWSFPGQEVWPHRRSFWSSSCKPEEANTSTHTSLTLCISVSRETADTSSIGSTFMSTCPWRLVTWKECVPEQVTHDRPPVAFVGFALNQTTCSFQHQHIHVILDGHNKSKQTNICHLTMPGLSKIRLRFSIFQHYYNNSTLHTFVCNVYKYVYI